MIGLVEEHDKISMLKTRIEIPFILFTSTETIGNKGYMSMDQLKEVESYSFAYLGNHSHSHEYMVNFNFKKFKANS